jgi:hypothetical protein
MHSHDHAQSNRWLSVSVYESAFGAPSLKPTSIRFSLLTAAALLVASIASAQVEEQLEYNFLGAGARANGMGDAFIAVADDATAIFWNPAGLFLLDQPEASFGFQFVSEKSEQERRQQMLLFASNDAGSSVGLNFASFVFPKRFGQTKFVFAFAVQRAFDFKAETLEIGARLPFALDRERSSGGPFSYTGGVAVSPLQGLMLGLSVSFYRGGADITESMIETLADGVVGFLSASSHLPFDGTSVGMGALYDFRSTGGPPMTLGLKFVPGFDLSGTVDADLGVRIADSEGVLFDERIRDGFDYVLDFPLDLGIGVAWTPRRNLLVAADFEHRRFRDATLSVFNTPNVSLDEDGNLLIQGSDEVDALSDSGADLNQWRAGLEWSWVKGLTVIPVRVGVKNLPQVSANERRFIDPADGALTTVFDDQVVGTAITSGVGIVTDAFVLDLSLEYGSWSQKISQFEGGETVLQELQTRRFSLKTSLVIYF